AVFHGYAHGTELPAGADALGYCLGFVIATGLLHLSGIALGITARWPAGKIGVQSAGAAIACAGLAFLWRGAWRGAGARLGSFAFLPAMAHSPIRPLAAA